jgi:hypothetical protein
VHPTGGTLRVFWQFAWLEAGSGKTALSRPAHQRVTPAVSLQIVRRKSLRYKFILLLASFIFMASCSGQPIQPSVVISASPLPSETLTLIPTLEPTKTPIPSVAPTPTYLPYQVKDVLFEYAYSGGDHGIFDDFVSPHIPKLVLYNDGFLIVTKDNALYQKILSEEEVRSFLSQIEQRGFYTIETNQNHDPSDMLYNFSENYVSAFDGRYLCVSAETQRICAYEPVMDYVIPQMKGIFKFLDGYFPNDLTPYEADRILLQVIGGSDYLPDEVSPEPMAWSADLPPLQETPTLFIEGESATKIFQLFNHSVGWRIMTSNDQEYTLFARPVLPHEVIGQP